MHSYPGMVALVTASFEGKDNIMAAGWHSYISYEPPIYGVAVGRERYTYELISKSGKYAINFLPFEKAQFIQQAGTVSGRDFDKLLGVEYERGLTTQCPILTDAYIAYECNVIDIRSYGDHDWIVADITNFYKDDTLFQDNGLVDLNKLNIPLYLGRSSYAKLDEITRIKKCKF
ncbi:flavin reductase family protein [Bacillus sp. HMF5848]|nr:flavin reductase family protein [Bacillus sp. HMF5848]